MAGISINGGSVSLPLEGTNAQVSYDAITETLRITGITYHDRVIEHCQNGVTDGVTVEFSVR